MAPLDVAVAIGPAGTRHSCVELPVQGATLATAPAVLLDTVRHSPFAMFPSTPKPRYCHLWLDEEASQVARAVCAPDRPRQRPPLAKVPTSFGDPLDVYVHCWLAVPEHFWILTSVPAPPPLVSRHQDPEFMRTAPGAAAA